MASNRTHIPVGRAGAAVACAALGVPILLWVVPIVAAHTASPWPDRLEKVPRALWRRTRNRWPDGNVDRLLRKLQVHRGWTHWLTVGLGIALAIGAAIVAVLLGLSALALMALERYAPDTDVALPPPALDLMLWLGIFAALGVFVGYALHSYLDGWTSLGSPMLGVPYRPATQRRRHAAPRWFIHRRVRHGKEPWLTERDEEAIRRWAPRVIVGCVAAHYHTVLWPILVQAVHAVAQPG